MAVPQFLSHIDKTEISNLIKKLNYELMQHNDKTKLTKSIQQKTNAIIFLH